VETLQLWCEQMLDNGMIDPELYSKYQQKE